MKKIMLIMLILLAGLSACNKNNTSQPETAATLPLKATTYITNNYPDATLDYVVVLQNTSAKYIAVLNTTEELAFTEAGEYLGKGENYHGEHPGGDTICGDTTHCGGGHHGGGHHGGGHHGGGHHGGDPNGIPVDSLSATITSYITTNYAGYTIRHAEIDTICPEGAVTEVMIEITGSEPVKLIFDASDNYLLFARRMSYTDFPQAVKDYFTTNYSAWRICDRGELFTLADNSLQYMVYMEQNRVRKAVRVAADGTLICER